MVNAPSADRTPTRIGAGLALRLVGYGVAAGLLVLALCDPEPFLAIWYGWQETSALNHAPYVMLFALYVAGRERWRLDGVVIKPSVTGFLLALGLAVVSHTGRATGIETLTELALLWLPLALAWALAGWQFMRRLWLAWLIYLCVTPVWPLFIAPLQNMTAHFAALGIRWSGIPLFQDRHYLTIPAGSFHIATYCAGIRYFTSGLLIGGIYAYALVGRFWRGAVVVALAAILSIVGNWLRVYMIILLGHVTDMQHPWIENHEFLGWLVFAGMMLFPLLLAGRWRHGGPIPSLESVGCRFNRAAGLPIVCAMGVAFVGAAITVSHLSSAPGEGLPQRLVSGAGQASYLPAQWSGPHPSGHVWHPVFPGAESAELAHYRTPEDEDLWLFVARYGRPHTKSEMVSSSIRWVDRFRWRLVTDEARLITQRDGTTVPARQLVMRNRRDPDTYMVMLFTYRVFGRYIASGPVVKLLQVPRFLSPSSGAVIIGVRSKNVAATEIARSGVILEQALAEFSLP